MLDLLQKDGIIVSMKSFKAEVLVDSKWSTNSCRFATQLEAEKAGRELLSRWYVPTDSRASESDDEINYRFNDEIGRGERIV